MFKRKIEDKLITWQKQKDKLPLVIKGVRQCGKTTLVKEFAYNNYENVVYIDFFKDKDACDAFNESLNIDNILISLSAIISDANFVPFKTVLILDEIQECPEARTALKYFKEDGRFDVIATGSLLGVNGYGENKDELTGKIIDNQPKSVPVGYEDIIEMYPMDFEEFLWANGINDNVINAIKEYYTKEKPVPNVLHNRMNELLRLYLIVGGMPAVVNKFVQTKQLNEVLRMQRNILNEYRDDMLKYASKLDKPRIRETFNSIPSQLAKEYKKFQYSKIKHGGRANEYQSSLQWIEDAGIISRSYNLNITELPLEGNKNSAEFKVFMNDPGLLVAMYEDGTQLSILKGDLYTYKGALYENLVASFFSKMSKKLYYFHKDNLECDHIIRLNNKVTIVETKASKGISYSANEILDNFDKYHVESLIKLGDYNVGRNGDKLTLPTYMGFLLND